VPPAEQLLGVRPQSGNAGEEVPEGESERETRPDTGVDRKETVRLAKLETTVLGRTWGWPEREALSPEGPSFTSSIPPTGSLFSSDPGVEGLGKEARRANPNGRKGLTQDRPFGNREARKARDHGFREILGLART
jgi:hypothetical protein